VIPIHDTPNGASFAIKVQPRAKRNAISGVVGDTLKISLSAPPLEGRANRSCTEFLAEVLDIPRSSITIAAGAATRRKMIRIAGMSAEEVRKRLQKSSAHIESELNG
jgi:uncharacterized protein (TIGR00251 family)